MILRILFLFFLFLIHIESSYSKLILEKNKRLNINKNLYKKMDLELLKIVKSIFKLNNANLKLKRNIILIKNKKNKNSKKAKFISSKIAKIQNTFKDLQDKINLQKSKLISLYINNLGILIIMKNLKKATIENIILEEIYNLESLENIKRIQKIKSKLIGLTKKKNNLNNKLSLFNKKRDHFNSIEDKLLLKKKLYSRNIFKLERKKFQYKRKLAKINLEKINLIKILKKLNIKNRSKFYPTIRENKTNVLLLDKSKIGSYKDRKTMSPIRNPKIIKKFGYYTEPIYNIKTFNTNIVFQIDKKDTKIENILDGEIVFINKKGILSTILIVAHKNNIHTIYAKISKINSSLYLGKKIFKGDFIGVANKKLIFEVTKNKKNINPEDLIYL